MSAEADAFPCDLEAFAPAKLNLGLEVIRRRPDGFHEIRTIFQALDWGDRLRLRRRTGSGILLRVQGPPSIPKGRENLVVRAATALAARRAPGKGVEILLSKRIPAGAGLGGGSSDAAATLLALERLWGLSPDPSELRALAEGLGSDIPFFFLGGTALGEGRGEILTPLPPAPDWTWILALPPLSVATEEAYRKACKGLTDSGERLRMLQLALVERAFAGFVDNLVNDLESGVFSTEPRLEGIKRALLAIGAPGVAMTGSGAALFAPLRSVVSSGPLDVSRLGPIFGEPSAVPPLPLRECGFRACRSSASGVRVIEPLR